MAIHDVRIEPKVFRIFRFRVAITCDKEGLPILMQPIRDVKLLLRINYFVVLAMPANLKAGIALVIKFGSIWIPGLLIKCPMQTAIITIKYLVSEAQYYAAIRQLR